MMVRLFVLFVGVPVVNAFAPPTARSTYFGDLSKRRCTNHHHHNTNLFHPSSLYTDRKYNKKSTTAREVVNGIQLADLLYDETSLAFDAWEWTANLGAPAALVAGAVLVTMSETRGEFAPRQSDQKWVRVAKQLTRLCLLSSFALEVISIFVSTVTGTVLLSHGAAPVTKAIGYGSPLGLLKHHHEFEYLTIRIGFLQGLLHWLAAVALEIMIPKEKEPLCARRMNAFMTTSLFTIIFWILAFYNHHLTFYGNYWHMLVRYGLLFRRRFFCGPFRPMSLLYGPSSLLSIFLGWRAFNTPPDTDDVDDADEKKNVIKSAFE